MTNSLSKYRHIFRAYDIRGILQKDIGPEIMFKIGKSLGKLQNEEGNSLIFVAGDIRISSDMLAHALIAGVTSQGIDVIFSAESMAFGEAMFSGWYHEADTTAFITASHLPPHWNGVKFYHSDGVGFSEDTNMQIRDYFLEDTYSSTAWDQYGQVEVKTATNEYINFLKEKFKLKKKVKVVIDCGNGSTAPIAPRIFETLGFTVVKLYCRVNPLNPKRESEPTPESLKTLSKMVVKESADFGVGFDGDGDRAIIVDNKGNILSPEKTGIILARKIIKQEQIEDPVIIANVECSMALEETFKDIKVKRIQVGHTFLTQKAKEYGDRTVLGLESSGHMVIPPIFLFDDSMPIPLLIGELLSQTNIPLAEMTSKIKDYPMKKGKVECPDEFKFDIVNDLSADLAKDYNINTIDGIRITQDNGSWVLIRASNTSPLIRITAEGKTDDAVEELFKKFHGILTTRIQKSNK